jgi:hypothetical protein
MKINEVLQPRHKEEYVSAHYRITVDTKRVTPAMLFSPSYWESNTVLKKGDMIRCVADDGSYAFDLIVDSQRLDASKSVKNIIAVSMFPDITDAVMEVAIARAVAKAAAAPQPVAPEAPAERPVETVQPVANKPAINSNVSFGKRKEIAKRQKLLDKRAEIEERNKARTAERLAAEAGAA